MKISTEVLKLSIQLPSRGKMELVPPQHERFSVYGGADTIERARQWAFLYRYSLVRNVPLCAHGFYLLDCCPNNGRGCALVDLDHVNIWAPRLGEGQSFLLAHPYQKKMSNETISYASAHGLDLSSDERDAWYGFGTIPIRMAVPQNWPLWPIEAESIILQTAFPIEWPG